MPSAYVSLAANRTSFPGSPDHTVTRPGWCSVTHNGLAGDPAIEISHDGTNVDAFVLPGCTWKSETNSWPERVYLRLRAAAVGAVEAGVMRYPRHGGAF